MTTPRKKLTRLFAHPQWQQCYRDFLQSVYNRSYSQDSLALYRFMLWDFFGTPDDTPQKRTPDGFTRAEVEAFLCRLTRPAGHPPATSTRNVRLRVLRSFYAFAARYEVSFRGKPRALLRQHPPTLGALPGKQRSAPRAMAFQDMQRVFAQIPRDTLKGLRDFALFSTYFWSARRRAEIVRLHWRDLELDYVFDDGRTGVLYHFRGKGKGDQDDSAELVAPAWQAMKVYLAAAGKLVLDEQGVIRACTLTPDDPIFPGRAGQSGKVRPLHRDTVSLLFRLYVKRAGLGTRGYCVHSLRHTAAHARHAAGAKITDIKELLRHKSLDTTYTYLQALASPSDAGASALYAQYGQL